MKKKQKEITDRDQYDLRCRRDLRKGENNAQEATGGRNSLFQNLLSGVVLLHTSKTQNSYTAKIKFKDVQLVSTKMSCSCGFKCLFYLFVFNS